MTVVSSLLKSYGQGRIQEPFMFISRNPSYGVDPFTNLVPFILVGPETKLLHSLHRKSNGNYTYCLLWHT